MTTIFMKKISLLLLFTVSITSCIPTSKDQIAERKEILNAVLNHVVFSRLNDEPMTTSVLAKYTTRKIFLMNLPAEYDLTKYSLVDLANFYDASDDMITYEPRTKKFNYLDEGLNIYIHENSTRYTYNNSIKEEVIRPLKNMNINNKMFDGKYHYMLDWLFKLYHHKFKYAPSQTIINRDFNESREFIEENNNLSKQPLLKKQRR